MMMASSNSDSDGSGPMSTTESTPLGGPTGETNRPQSAPADTPDYGKRPNGDASRQDMQGAGEPSKAPVKASVKTEKTETPPPPSDEFRDGLIANIPSLRAFAMSLVGNGSIADDLVQETLTKAWHKSHMFQPGTNLRAWLFTILRNERFSQLRKKRPEVDDEDGALQAGLSEAPAQQANIDIEDLKSALAQLPADQREAVILVGASGFSYEEAAQIAGCATGTVKSRVNRARKKLAEIMQVERGDAFGPDKAVASIIKSPTA